ncbi:LacI family DNA-binding transcriptional regulator [Arthrobacter sp. SX1312]|uniref:LacI family DNA-binding transcriptional regulator n=1 Tax=Arthrobacter sp. SX1312 TaxID=2058896 RepID=UPI000CE575F9|nr:LacI family DNA-binding transcriptional regulator [Arthrobacter sp. SX1312]
MGSSSSRRKDATVADVAREAKVSKAQAARALGAYGAVSDEVRSRVLAAAAALEYRPNEVARSMNTGRSKTLGVVVGDIENPFFSLAMRGISDAAKAEGFDVILINTGEDVTAEAEAVRVLLDKRVDGMIVAPASQLSVGHLRDVVESGRPLVLLDRQIPALGVSAAMAKMDGTAYEAVSHLIEVGHTRIGYISSLDVGSWSPGEELDLGTNPVSERLAGMRRAFRAAGIPVSEDLIRLSAGKPQPIREIVEELLQCASPATAIIASDSLIALDVLRTIQDLDMRIPEDVSFMMYDDMPWAQLMKPPITVVAQPVYDIGAATATALLDQILGRPLQPGNLLFESELLLRGSVGAPNRPAGISV